MIDPEDNRQHVRTRAGTQRTAMADVALVAEQVMRSALNYIRHVGANAIMRGDPHPQQKIVDDLTAALAAIEQARKGQP